MTALLAAKSARGRWVLTAAVLGSGMALLDGTVVNIALPHIGRSLDASIADLQWVVNAYLVALAALILVGGSLGDRVGRRRVFMVGVGWFALASALCAVSQSPVQLIAARAVQGIGAALLTPGSLAIIQGSFQQVDRGRVIGRWAGLGGIAGAAGPVLGGFLIEAASWRWIFALNVPVAAVVLLICARHVPETSDPQAARGFDVVGAAVGALGLAGITFALIEHHSTYAVPVGVAGAVAFTGFVAVEHWSVHPLIELGLFGSRVFWVSNLMTLLVYGALGALMFFLVLQLQVSTGYTALQAGLATLPVTVVLLLLSSRSGDLASRIGPRWQMSVGPVACGVGAWLLHGVDARSGYLTGVFPGIVVFALGLAALVAPLTASVLAAAPDRLAGSASGINNAVARTGSLLAVAALPAVVGLSGDAYRKPALLTASYSHAELLCALLLVAGGVVSFVGLAGTGTRGSP